MENLRELISQGDYFILFAYAILGYFGVKYFFFRHTSKNFKKLLAIFFTFKIACAVLMTLLIIYYWGVSDNVAYFNEAGNITKLIKRDFWNIRYFFLPVEYYKDRLALEPDLMTNTSNIIGLESNFIVAKFCALFYPLALGKYLLVNFFFALFACVGQLKMYLAISNRYPQQKKKLAIGILFIPNVLLYSSYINKETLCMAFIGFALYYFYRIQKREKIVQHGFLLLLNLLLIGMVKYYVLVAFAAALLLVYLLKLIYFLWKKSFFSRIFIIVTLVVSGYFFFSNLSFFDKYIVDFADTSNLFQKGYNADYGETTSFEFGEIETSFSGLLQKMPLGIFTTYFRPQLWEVNKPIMVISALESFIILVLLCWTLFIKRKYLRTLLKKDAFLNISLYYILIFGVIVGLTTFNFGTLVRYKIPAVPFLLVFIIMLSNYVPEDKKQLKENR